MKGVVTFMLLFFTSFITALPLAKRDSSDSDSKSKNGLIEDDEFEMFSESLGRSIDRAVTGATGAVSVLT